MRALHQARCGRRALPRVPRVRPYVRCGLSAVLRQKRLGWRPPREMSVKTTGLASRLETKNGGTSHSQSPSNLSLPILTNMAWRSDHLSTARR